MKINDGQNPNLEFLSEGKKGTTAKIIGFQKKFDISDKEMQKIRINFGGKEKIIVSFFEYMEEHFSQEEINTRIQMFVDAGEIFSKIRTDILNGSMAPEKAFQLLEIPIFSTIFTPFGNKR